MPLEDRTILYVEDDKNMREWIVNNLEDSVRKVISTDNCEDGLELYHKNDDIDIIITDIFIDKPNAKDGLDMVREIRKHDRHTPILITTAYENIDNLRRGIDLYLDGFLVKVFKYETLENKLIEIHQILLEKEEEERRRIEEIEEKILEKIYGKEIINISGTIIYDPNIRTLKKEGAEVQITPSQAILFEFLYSLKLENQIATSTMIDYEFSQFYDRKIFLRGLVSTLRKRLHDDFSDIVIENIRGQGYRLEC